VDRFEDLLSEYLDGTLDAAGRAELASLIDADPARREAFVDMVREHRVLSAELGDPAGEGFTRKLMTELNKDRTQFVRAVMADLKGPGSGGTRPAPKPRRPLRPRDTGTPGWVVWTALAAGLLVIIAVLMSIVGGEEPARPDRKTVKERSKPARVEPAPAPQPEIVKEPEPPPTPRPEPAPLPKPELPKPDPLRPTPAPSVKVEPVPAPAPKPTLVEPEKAPATLAEVAKLESVDGDVGLNEAAAKPGPLTAGFILDTRTEKSAAVIRYPDGTRVDVGGLTRLQDEPTKPGRVLTLNGVLSAEVAKQPADKPMLFLTPHAEVRVLGTRLKVDSAGDSTRLDVTEGRVRLTRLKDKASVEVAAGHHAIAGSTGSMTSRLTRASSGLIALYSFKEGKGGIVHDTSRAGAPLDLKIENEAAVKWTSKGLLLGAPTMVASPGAATKIAQACRQSNEITIEVWVRPATLTPAGKDCRIVTLSADYLNQDFILGQDELKGPARSYFTRLRTTSTDLVGKPALATPDNTLALKPAHVVYTRNAAGVAALYVDGVESAHVLGAGSFTNWSEGYRLALGNEFGTDRSWLGEYQFVAIHAKALTADEVKQNFKAGAE